MSLTDINPKFTVQCLILSAWKDGDRGFKPRSGIQVSKKENISTLLTRKIQYCGEHVQLYYIIFSYLKSQLKKMITIVVSLRL